MRREDTYMDDAFRKVNSEFIPKYQSDYWAEMERTLNDAQMDDAFVSAIENPIKVQLPTDFQTEISNSFLDDAFKSAADQHKVTYDAQAWSAFLNNEQDYLMDDAFKTASSQFAISYDTRFWKEANLALEKEGLHYEYHEKYWHEAKVLLDKNDRKMFFAKWSSVAALLLFLSVISVNKLGDINKLVQDMEQSKDNTTNFIDNSTGSIQTISVNEVKTKEENVSFSSESFNENRANRNDALVNETSLVAGTNARQSVGAIEMRNEEGKGEEGIKKSENDKLVASTNSGRNASVFNESFVEILTVLTKDINPITGETELTDFNASFMSPINKRIEKPIHIVSLFGGIGMGNQYNSAYIGLTNRVAIGVNYNFYNGSKVRDFEFGTSAQFNRVSQSNLSSEKRVTKYLLDGTADRSWYKVQYKELLFANLNFTTAYRMNTKNKILMGVGVERLLSAKTNLAYKLGEKQVMNTQNNTWGMADGINPWDVRLSLGISHKVSARLNMRVTGTYGILDRTSSDVINKFERNNELNVLLGLTYDLFRKF